MPATGIQDDQRNETIFDHRVAIVHPLSDDPELEHEDAGGQSESREGSRAGHETLGVLLQNLHAAGEVLPVLHPRAPIDGGIMGDGVLDQPQSLSGGIHRRGTHVRLRHTIQRSARSRICNEAEEIPHGVACGSKGAEQNARAIIGTYASWRDEAEQQPSSPSIVPSNMSSYTGTGQGRCWGHDVHSVCRQ